ncbi:MAG: serine/threonine-protein kinase, partial [Actinomycetota bacterium]
MKVCPVCQRCYENSVFSCSEINHEPLTKARSENCEIIANYRLEFLLESSPSGETYRAVNTILNKIYLIKILAPELFDENLSKQFLRETQSLSAIIHPNVARVYESGALADGSLYVVTEFPAAQTLRDCLENVGAPSEVTALTITRQAAEGLEAIHAVNVLHRNICPENIILTADAANRFLVKIQNIDFGGIRQKTINSNNEPNLNSFRYFSPEQCAAQTVDAQTDIYALGIVLYEALAGQPPFAALDSDTLINKQINEVPPPVAIHNFDIRMLLTHTLTDALQKMTRLRLKTANAFVRRIRHIEQLATHSPTPPPAMSYPAAMDKTAIVFSPTPKIENPAVVESKTVIENSVLMVNQPVTENPVAFETRAIAEKTVLSVKAFDDFTTTKLPPIETIIGNLLPENVPEARTNTVFYETAGNSDIHITKEAVLVEWEQPDDFPAMPKPLKTEKKETVNKGTNLIDDEDSIIDAGEFDAPRSGLSKTENIRRNYAAEHSVLSYNDSGTV